MKSIFEKEPREELIARITTLNENSTPQWGKMNVYQMMKHCTLWEEMIAGKTKYKQSFIGRLIGKMILKKEVKDDSPLGRNTPTIPEFIIKENGDITAQKKQWIAMLEKHENFSNPDFVHPFFGKMTKEQIGILSYKHNDHHLRQFNS